MGYCGCATIDEMQNQSRFGNSAGITRKPVHDVQCGRTIAPTLMPQSPI
jgi:hypothetical protein